MKLLLPIAIFLMMVSIGTSFQLAEMRKSVRAMTLLSWIMLLLGVFLIPPALALALARILPLNLSEIGGLFLIGVAPGAPLLFRNVSKRGFNAQEAAVYQVTVAIMTPIMIPLLVAAAAKLYDRDIWIPPAVLLAQVAEKQFLPLLVGMALMKFAPAFSNRIRPILNTIGNVVMIAFIGIILFKMRVQLLQITPWVIVATILLAAGSMAAIYLLQTDPSRKRTLAICNANRHIGLALLLSGQYLHNKDALPTVACYALAAPLVMWLYAKRFQPEPLPAAVELAS